MAIGSAWTWVNKDGDDLFCSGYINGRGEQLIIGEKGDLATYAGYFLMQRWRCLARISAESATNWLNTLALC